MISWFSSNLTDLFLKGKHTRTPTYYLQSRWKAESPSEDINRVRLADFQIRRGKKSCHIKNMFCSQFNKSKLIIQVVFL